MRRLPDNSECLVPSQENYSLLTWKQLGRHRQQSVPVAWAQEDKSVRNQFLKWEYVAFYSLTDPGAELTDFVLVLNTKEAVKTFSQFGNITLGGNVSGTAAMFTSTIFFAYMPAW